MDSNQNNETGKPATDDVAANEQNILPADIPPPAPLENQLPPSEITPPQTQPPMEVHHHGHVTKRKMERISLPIPHVVPCCVLWFHVLLA